jgi:hypothetical protein
VIAIYKKGFLTEALFFVGLDLSCEALYPKQEFSSLSKKSKSQSHFFGAQIQNRIHRLKATVTDL